MHDLLLALAGRLDDDALADARELLASTEVDRALELIVGSLASGPIPVTRVEHEELTELMAAAHCDPAVAERLAIAESTVSTSHKFSTGKIGGIGADQGVAEATIQVLDVLPDIRAVWAVWRLTPAGAASGPVPHRVVLIRVGPSGSGPATAYRVEHALRRAGLTASVEVLRDSTESSDYHHSAMRYATAVPLERSSTSPPSWTPSPTPKPAPAPKPAKEPWIPQAGDEADADDQELSLLRELQEELARREGGETPAWKSDTSYDWQEANRSTLVNGVPLQAPDQS
ncbi:predicted protein [Alloactinosynnema sp. L-07]|uniref:hypothetical protein n=1 Tax=Alloactinosynnema sp. L-07 TaxID=1653480 RepID=UPI00065F08A8|nr:hypothetical protein [Alloactinosynnema sp. L-07]CRK61042.1 predicted protein [Alloactinosynnema sp. L-07]